MKHRPVGIHADIRPLSIQEKLDRATETRETNAIGTLIYDDSCWGPWAGEYKNTADVEHVKEGGEKNGKGQN